MKIITDVELLEQPAQRISHRARASTPTVVRTFEEAARALASEPRLALDLETSGFSPWRDRIHVISLFGAESNTIAVLHYPRHTPVPQNVLDWLSLRPELIIHNGVQFDVLFLAQAGMDWSKPAIYDTMIAEQGISIQERQGKNNQGEGLFTLAACVRRHLGKEVDKSIEHGRWGELTLDDSQLAYCVGDIQHMLALREKQVKKALQTRDNGALVYPGMLENVQFEMQLAKVVIRMQLNGLTIDRCAIETYLSEMRAKDEQLEPRLRAVLDIPQGEVDAWIAERDAPLAALLQTIKPDKVAAAVKGMDGCRLPPAVASALARIRSGTTLMSSSDQLQAALAIRYGAKRFPDTTKETLLTYAQMGGEIGQLCEDLIRWRQITKRESMFSPEWFLAHAEDYGGVQKVHGHFWQLRTNTGRFSASDPNLQQVPKDMRHCFGNREGWAVGHSDYTGIELRVMASLAGDTNMMAAFAAGEDIHAAVVAAAFGKPIEQVTSVERRIGKAMNFTLTFGGSWQTFYNYAHVNGASMREDDAEAIFGAMLSRFSGVAAMRVRAEEMMNRGRPVTLTFPTGLRRQLMPGVHRPTTLLNNMVQSVAAAGLKKGMIEAAKDGLDEYLTATVHDELVYEAPLSMIEEVRAAMDQALLRGMQWALREDPAVMIGVESSWGKTWQENPETLRVTQAMSRG